MHALEMGFWQNGRENFVRTSFITILPVRARLIEDIAEEARNNGLKVKTFILVKTIFYNSL